MTPVWNKSPALCSWHADLVQVSLARCRIPSLCLMRAQSPWAVLGLCAPSPISIFVLGALGQSHSVQCHLSMRCPCVVGPPSTEKSQVLLCAATFKFRGHLSIAFSWSLAFSRPKNGPDRTAGRSRTAKTIFHRSLRHTTSCERRHQVLDGPLAPLPHLQGRDTLCVCLCSAHTCHLRSPLQSAMLRLYKHNT